VINTLPYARWRHWCVYCVCSYVKHRVS